MSSIWTKQVDMSSGHCNKFQLTVEIVDSIRMDNLMDKWIDSSCVSMIYDMFSYSIHIKKGSRSYICIECIKQMVSKVRW